ncbi:MAG: sigma-E processing peptidase SpoIIGA [Bacillota bacterium]
MTNDLILDPYLRNAVLDLLMDGTLLWAAAAVVGRRTRLWRLLAAAGLGGVYNLWVGLARDGFLPGWPALGSLPVYFLVLPAMMLAVAFFPFDRKGFLRLVGAFFFLALLAWGLAGAVFYFAAAHGRSFSPFFCTFLEIGLGLAAAELGWGVLHRAALAGACRVDLSLKVGSFTLETEGYFDTGNHLLDPFTHRPVVVLDYGLIRRALSPAARSFIEAVAEGASLPFLPPDDPWLTRLRVVPYRSVERRLGLLPGVRVDEIRLRRRNLTVTHRMMVVGLERIGVLGAEGCRALVPPALWSVGAKG